MDFVVILLVAAVVFSACFLLDKGFSKVFRGKKQHKSGLAVRVNKRYGSIGLIVVVLGLAAVLTALPDNWFLLFGGCLLILVGVCLVIYYMTFGIFYDEDGFVLTSFGKRSKTYHYGDICTQQLYISYNNTLIELQLSDSRSVQLQASMEGTYHFLDYAFNRWLKETGKNKEDYPHYDPQNSCWFPAREE